MSFDVRTDEATTRAQGLRTRSCPRRCIRALHVGRDQYDEPFLQIDKTQRRSSAAGPGHEGHPRAGVDRRGRSPLRPAELQGVIDEIESYARLYGQRQHVWVGMAPNDEGGIDMITWGMKKAIVRVVPGRVDLVADGTTTLFYRTPRVLRRMWSKDRRRFLQIVQVPREPAVPGSASGCLLGALHPGAPEGCDDRIHPPDPCRSAG